MISPKQQGYKMPPEWHTHSATQLHWPSNRETWPGERLERVEEVYLDIINTLHRYEHVILLVENAETGKRAETRLTEVNPDYSSIHVFEVPLNDVWARDCGPIFIRKKHSGSEKYAVTNWDYNAWGEKYPPFQSDNALPMWFADKFKLPAFTPGMILEGGSIDTNGDGIFLTTESVLLNPNRNPEFSKTKIEKKLSDFLGAEKIIWLKEGLKGDDTDGHIDDLSRFLNKNTILTMVCDDPGDVNADALTTNLNIQREAADLQGNPFHIVTLPLPRTKIEGTTVDGSEYVPASYANFYIANGVVLVPLYDERYDDEALEVFGHYFPDRDIVGIHCADLVWGQGSIHCITQQLYGLNFFE